MGEVSIGLINEIRNCQRCESIIGYKKYPITSRGGLRGKYILVSEAPGKESLNQRKYWSGEGCQILRSCAMTANTTLESLFYMTDVVKCWPNEAGKNRSPINSEILNCADFLKKEISELRPNLVVCFGKLPSSLLLQREVKITEEHGNIYSYSNHTKILLLLHPRGVDKHMDKNIYKKQLLSLFRKLKEGKDDEIEGVFHY
jgi:uracil-DNA glycosylase